MESSRQPPFLAFPILAFGAAALFIAHHLIVPAIRERRWVVDYSEYFDIAWKAGVQLALSVGFTGAFWLLLHLGASLFKMIGLSFLQTMLGEAWFSIPVTALTFATAVQLTDVRDGLIRGVRTVALMLLSWLLLVITVLVAGFLAALPFTGLDGLWETRSATALVLSAAAALIVLINTAYQDGRPDNLPPAALRYGVRAASVPDRAAGRIGGLGTGPADRPARSGRPTASSPPPAPWSARSMALAICSRRLGPAAG